VATKLAAAANRAWHWLFDYWRDLRDAY